MRHALNRIAGLAACTMLAINASAQSAGDILGPSPLIAIENEAPAKLVVDPPLPGPLVLGRSPRAPLAGRKRVAADCRPE